LSRNFLRRSMKLIKSSLSPFLVCSRHLSLSSGNPSLTRRKVHPGFKFHTSLTTKTNLLHMRTKKKQTGLTLTILTKRISKSFSKSYSETLIRWISKTRRFSIKKSTLRFTARTFGIDLLWENKRRKSSPEMTKSYISCPTTTYANSISSCRKFLSLLILLAECGPPGTSTASTFSK